MNALRMVPFFLLFGCQSYWSERQDKAVALVANAKNSDAAALGGVATVCLAPVSFKGKPQLEVRKLPSGSHGLRVITQVLALTQSKTLEHARKNVQAELARNVLCAMVAGKPRKLDTLLVSARLPTGGAPQEIFQFKVERAALDRVEGWESLDPSDFDDMQKLWASFEVLKEDFEGLSIQ